MKELSLQELKAIELGILKKFHSFCQENHIRYFLAQGTLLGAIRHKGFIPGDDDVDVIVPRKDYDRLIALFRDDERYRLYAFERNPDYRFPFAKLCDAATCKVETNYNNGVELGVDIDIFPLDFWDPEKTGSEIRRIQRNLFFLDLTKLRRPNSINPIKRAVKGLAMLLCKPIGSRFFIRRIIETAAKKESKPNACLGCKVWCLYGKRDVHPAEVFAETIDVAFEGALFPAPAGYDAYLRNLYGDYMTEPPEKERKTHHSFQAYRRF